MKTYLRNEFITIQYTTEQKIIQLTWTGFVDSDLLRNGLDKAIELARRYQLQFWVMDQRLRRVLRPSDAEWIITDWFPRFQEIDPKSKVAILLPEDTFGEYNTRKNLQEIEKRYAKVMPYQYFHTLKQAQYWFEKS
ncbi:hypothetical protein BKI52_16230 [marine bacterium AO1-C]|nr:hypothetical protein BKI52_16230 [marine bacterium AO1-C]